MKVPKINYLREATTTKLSDDLAEMREEFDETQKAHMIARSRVMATEKIIDAIFNKAEIVILGADGNRNGDYPLDEIIEELKDAGYKYETEEDGGYTHFKITL